MEWKVIPQFPKYEASDTGEIRHIDYKIIKTKSEQHGYYKVTICLGKNKKLAQRVHRLVAFAWIENPLKKPAVNHIDGDRKNNNINNLEWVTSKENYDHAVGRGAYDHLHIRTPKTKKVDPRIKLTENDVKDILKLKGTMPVQKIADQYNVSKKTIESVLYGWSWKHVDRSVLNNSERSQ